MRDPLPPLVRVPKDELILGWEAGAPYVVVKAWTREMPNGERAYHGIKMRWHNFPNDIVDLDDLKRHGAYEAYLDAVA